MTRTVAAINTMVRHTVEGRLPDWIEPRWFSGGEEFAAISKDVELGWLELWEPGELAQAIEQAPQLKWITTVAAGVEKLPLPLMHERGVILTNGAGVNANVVAEYAVLGLLVVAKGYRDVVHAQDRHEWLEQSPGTKEVNGSRALILGGGNIGGRVAHLLRPFDVEVVTVRRSPAPGAIGPGEWRDLLGTFDWVIVAVPSMDETIGMIGAAELAAMKPGSAILNFARGNVIDQDALVAALGEGRLGGAFLDVTDPEPLPPEHPLWSFDNVHISMHLSGRAQKDVFSRCGERFLANLEHYRRGEPLISAVNLAVGY